MYLAVRDGHPRVSFGTVYRNLNILVDQNEVRRLESSRDKDRFDAQRPFHAHFHCEKCGGIFDMPFTEEARIITNGLEKKTGHTITGHNVDFYGVCADCAASD